MTRKKRLLRDAHHEAGHAVAAWWSGLSVRLISLKPDATTWTRVEYDHHETFRPGTAPSAGDRSEWRKWVKSHAVATIAGPLAVMILTGDDGRGDDILGDKIVASQWIKEGGLDAVECIEAAEALVAKAWPLIEAIAVELTKRMELTGEQMQDVIQPILRGMMPA